MLHKLVFEKTNTSGRQFWKEGLGNFKPVSLATVQRKVMEQIIMSAIKWHVRTTRGSGLAIMSLGKADPV